MRQPKKDTAFDSGESVAVCLPTYNEAENTSRIVAAIRELLPKATILIVDDDSPDGTGEIAKELAIADPHVRVMNRAQKNGLGRAYCDGFSSLLTTVPHVYRIVQMDADFSHPVARLPEMLQVSRNAHLVLGSRYIEGGAFCARGAHRRWLSRFGSLYSKILTGLPLQDLTGGFKIWDSRLLNAVLSHSPSAMGYGFQIETTFLAALLGAVIREVPIVFQDREGGKSKMTYRIAAEAFWRVPLLRLQYRDVQPVSFDRDAGGDSPSSV